MEILPIIPTALITVAATSLMYFMRSIVKSIDELKSDSKDNQKEIRGIVDRLTRIELKQEDVMTRLEKIEKAQELLSLELREIKTYQNQNQRSAFEFSMFQRKMMEQPILEEKSRELSGKAGRQKK